MRVAAVQTNPSLGRTAANLDGILRHVASTNADLVVFPECALQGYGFDSKEAAAAVAEPVQGPSLSRLADACRSARRHAIVGLIERGSGGRLFNAAVLVGPGGVLGVYRKAHLPFIGADRYMTPGDLGLPVFETPFARVGMLICYDLSFPEASRVLKLRGAQVVCIPTNWPLAAEISCVHAPPVRAQENHVHVVTCDRVGEEAGFRFRGESSIVEASGKIVARAGVDEETITAELDAAAADASRVVIVPGQYELDRLRHRRPELYG